MKALTENQLTALAFVARNLNDDGTVTLAELQAFPNASYMAKAHRSIDSLITRGLIVVRRVDGIGAVWSLSDEARTMMYEHLAGTTLSLSSMNRRAK